MTHGLSPDPPATVALVIQPSPPPSEDPGGKSEDFGKSSPVGFLVLLLFFIAVAFLIRSMNKHLKRVPKTFDKTEAEPEPAAAQPDAADQPADPEAKT